MKIKNMCIGILFFVMCVTVCSVQYVWSDENVEVHVTAILAAHTSQYVDPDLSAIANEMQTLFTYSSYKKLKRYTIVLSESESDRIILPEDNPLVVRYGGLAEDNKINISLFMGDFFNTDFSMSDGGHILIGGPECGDGTLILMIESKRLR
jgi:hypothetical protein